MDRTENEPKAASEYRCLTPGEIARTVKNRRELLGRKQLTLAQRAGITEHALQRLERGEKVDDQTLRQMASAVGLATNCFSGPRMVCSLEEGQRRILAFLDRFQLVKAKPIEDWRNFEALMESAATLVDDTEIDADSAEQAAELRDYLGESLDVLDLLDTASRIDRGNATFRTLESITSQGIVALCDRRHRGQSRARNAHPTPRRSRAGRHFHRSLREALRRYRRARPERGGASDGERLTGRRATD